MAFRNASFVPLVTFTVYLQHINASQDLPQGVPTAVTALLVEIARYLFFEKHNIG